VAAVSRHRSRSPDVGIDLISEIAGLLADAQLRDWLMGRMHIDAHIAMLLLGVRVKCKAGYKAVLNKAACACGCDVTGTK